MAHGDARRFALNRQLKLPAAAGCASSGHRSVPWLSIYGRYYSWTSKRCTMGAKPRRCARVIATETTTERRLPAKNSSMESIDQEGEGRFLSTAPAYTLRASPRQAKARSATQLSTPVSPSRSSGRQARRAGQRAGGRGRGDGR
jgi:hypothetical protein